MNDILFMLGDMPVRTGAALIVFGVLALESEPADPRL